MTTGGWITMIISVGSVVVLFSWCLYKVLAHNPPAGDVTEASLRDEIHPDRR